MNQFYFEKIGNDFHLSLKGYDPVQNPKLGSVFTQCNGNLGIRGTQDFPCLNRKPGYYLGGFYNQGMPSEPEELVNLPDVTAFNLIIDGTPLVLEDASRVSNFHRTFNLTTGAVVTRFQVQAQARGYLEVCVERFVSHADKAFFVQRLTLTAHGKTLPVRVISGIDGQVSNEGVGHLSRMVFRVVDETMLLSAYTQDQCLQMQSAFRLAESAREYLIRKDFSLSRRRIDNSFALSLPQDIPVQLVKISRGELVDRDVEEDTQLKELVMGLQDAHQRGYDELLSKSRQHLVQLLEKSRVEIDGISPEQKNLIQYAQLQLIGMIPPAGSTFSIGAKGLTGEGYRGHVFCDTEIYLFPFILNLDPEAAKRLLRFRVKGLPGAREKALENGYKGAMYPWEATNDGYEKTPPFAAINIHTGKATPVWSGRKEHHITADIIYALDNYLQATGDFVFLWDEAFPMVVEAAQFWVSRAVWDEEKAHLRILDVIGPDEYTEHIDDNAYTNYLAHHCVRFALKTIEQPQAAQLWGKAYNLEALKGSFKEFLDLLLLPQPNNEGVVPQDSTFFSKPILHGLEKYRDNPKKQTILQDYSRDEIVASQVLKQADVVILQILLPKLFEAQTRIANLDYYEPKTLHDSSLSPCVHAIAFADVGKQDKALEYFSKSLRIDINDHWVDSVDGLHAGALGGIWLSAVRGFAGVKITAEGLEIQPRLPAGWVNVRFPYRYLSNQLDLFISHDTLQITRTSVEGNQVLQPLILKVAGKTYKLIDRMVINF